MTTSSLTSKIKNELAKLGQKANKTMSQNFLVNEMVYKKIVEAGEIKKDDLVVEVGPGTGTLTQYLLEAGAKIIAIEKDRKLTGHLKNKFKNSNAEIVEGDILKFNPADYKLETGSYKLIGNIPYYLTSHLFRLAFENWPRPKLIVFMIQKEVAQRITAKPPGMSLLAVSIQIFSQPKIISRVSKGDFYPMPNVDSAIIQLKPLEEELLPPENVPNFFKIVKIGFSGKRKQLAHNFSAGLQLEREFVDEKLNSIGIDSKRRAETLSINEWLKVVKIFS